MIASNIVILHHLTSVISCYFMVCPATLLSRGPPSWICVDSNPNKDRNQESRYKNCNLHLFRIFLGFFYAFLRPYYTHFNDGLCISLYGNCINPITKNKKNVNRYITIFRYQMLELWATSLFDNGYIWFYIPTMESFVNAGIWLTGPIFNPSRISIYVNLPCLFILHISPEISSTFFLVPSRIAPGPPSHRT